MPLMQTTTGDQETQEKIDKLEDILKSMKTTIERNEEFNRKIVTIILKMNERDVNREPLYEELDKLTKWYMPKSEQK